MKKKNERKVPVHFTDMRTRQGASLAVKTQRLFKAEKRAEFFIHQNTLLLV